VTVSPTAATQAGTGAGLRGWASPARLALGVAGVGLAADAASKSAALALLPQGDSARALGGVVRLSVHHNPGAALGIGAGLPLVWSAAAVAVLAAAWLVLPRVRTRGMALAWGLIVAGTAGNLTDRVFRGSTVGTGSVVDWVQVPWYPPWFNLADLALRLGAIVLLWSTVRDHRDGLSPSGPDPGAT
jgi:signal peptidase II